MKHDQEDLSLKTVRIGIVGAKFAGSFHADVWKNLPGAEITAVVNRGEEARLAFQKKYGIRKAYADYRDLLADPDVDVVDVCVPNYLHGEISSAALLAGKHVICEKPFATTMEDAEKVLEAWKKSGRSYFYAEDWIFAPALKRAEAIYRSGGIGKGFYFKGKETHSGSHSPYAQTIEYCGGGAIIHLGSHPIGYFNHLLGLPAEVTGCCNGGLKDNFIHKSLEGEDWGLGVLHYPGGEKVLVEGNYITVGGMDDVVEFYGDQGVIKVELTFGSPLSVFSTKGIDYTVEKAETTVGWSRPAVGESESLGYRPELAHFLACIQGTETQIAGTTAQGGFDTFRIIHTLYRSSREGRTLPIV